jgi:hypothetical protein
LKAFVYNNCQDRLGTNTHTGEVEKMKKMAFAAQDQGGSTTMWVKGEPNDGVVSVNEWAPRSVYSALFVAYNQQ